MLAILKFYCSKFQPSSLTDAFFSCDFSSFTEPHKIEGLILNLARFQTFVRDLLLVKQYRVEVYNNQGTSKNHDWILEYKGSPGNLSQFEEILFGNNEIAVSGSLMALKLGTGGKSRVRNILVT